MCYTLRSDGGEVTKQQRIPTLPDHPICGATIWPYTENNICVQYPDHDGNHVDARGREFNHFELIKKKD